MRRALRLAGRRKLISRIPRFELLPGEHSREFVLSRKLEPHYFAACPEPLRSVAELIVNAGLRVGEALSLQWPDVHLKPVGAATRGYIHVRTGKSHNAKRNISLTKRSTALLKRLQATAIGPYVFVREDRLSPLSRFTLEDQHKKAREALNLAATL